MDAIHFLATSLGAAAVAVAALLAWQRFRSRQSPEAARGAIPAAFVAEHMPVAVLLFASDGRIRFANRWAERLLFAGSSPLGKNFLRMVDLAPPPVRDALLGTGDALLQLESDGERETFQKLRRDLEVDGQPHTLLLVNPLTREVSRREIEVLKKVIAVIGHELNNSLATIGSLTNSAHYIVENPEQLPKLATVLRGIEARTQHLQHFLSEYAALSRLPEPRPAEVEWAPLLARIGAMFPEITLESPPSCSAWFDEVQVEQATINLVKNALEAGGAAGDVRVVFRERPDAVELGVLDRGGGFSKEALQHGLLPFYSTKQGGTGVGLALCREVVEGHGGSLRIRAREGGGSGVYLVLPKREGERIETPSVVLTLTRS
jgi:two-component system nitrogen regulation sensor histidine kinase NtrY